MTKTDFLKAYKKIFKSQGNSSFAELLQRGLLFQYDKEIKHPNLLFVGINPSFDKKIPFIEDSYSKENAKTISYFKAFHRVEEQLKNQYSQEVTWTHLDLCVFRETKQSTIMDELIKKDGAADFIYQQLLVSDKLLKQIQPEIIIVSNTLARKFLGFDADNGNDVWLGYEFEFDDQIGTQRIVSPSVLKNTPVFFTSMLSGQRTLDIGSKQRLVWHINEVLNSL